MAQRSTIESMRVARPWRGWPGAPSGHRARAGAPSSARARPSRTRLKTGASMPPCSPDVRPRVRSIRRGARLGRRASHPARARGDARAAGTAGNGATIERLAEDHDAAEVHPATSRSRCFGTPGEKGYYSTVLGSWPRSPTLRAVRRSRRGDGAERRAAAPDDIERSVLGAPSGQGRRRERRSAGSGGMARAGCARAPCGDRFAHPQADDDARSGRSLDLPAGADEQTPRPKDAARLYAAQGAHRGVRLAKREQPHRSAQRP